VEKRKYILTIIFVGIIVVLYILMNLGNKKKIEEFKLSKIKQYELIYESIYSKYKQRAEIILDSVVDDKKVLELFHKRDREALYLYLQSQCEVYSKYNLNQFHFHLPNNDSFLRFNRFNQFGDNLDGIRETVTYVNKNKVAIDGFEEGKIFNGYRYIYPLYYDKKVNKYLGSVEVSFSAYSMISEIMELYDAKANFIISKEVVDKKVLKSEKKNYIDSPYPDYYYMKAIKDKLTIECSKLDTTLPKTITDEVSNKIKDKKTFAIYNKDKETLEIIIPILNPITTQAVAAIIIEAESEFIQNKKIHFFILFSTLVGLLSIIYYTIFKLFTLNSELKDNHQKLYYIINEANSGIATLDKKGNFLEVNDMYTKLLGYTKEEFKTLNCVELSTSKYEKSLMQILKEVLQTGKVITGRKECISKDGAIVHMELSFNRLPDCKSFVIIANSLDEKLQLEATHKELKLLNENLHEKVKVQVDKLRLQDKILFQQSKLAAMGEIMDAVSHQWKQPLSVIKLTASEIEMAVGLNEFTKEYGLQVSKKIENQVNHLIETIDEFSGFFRPRVNLEEITVKKLIDSTLLLMKDELMRNTIQTTFSGDETLTVNIIPNEFKHVLLNIISNAKDEFVIQNKKNAKIDFIVEKLDSKIQLKIQDNAGGVPEELIPIIFNAHTTTKSDKKGSGIGLYMSKNIIEKINGTISVENNETGAVFIIMIPINQ